MDARRVNQSVFYQILNVCQSVNQSVSDNALKKTFNREMAFHLK